MSRTELQFQNHAVSLLAPHLAFRLGTVASFSLTLGKAICYQFRGDGLNNTTLYLTGGGLTSADTISGNCKRQWVGTLALEGILRGHVEPTHFNGTLRVTAPLPEGNRKIQGCNCPCSAPIPEVTPFATLTGTLHGIDAQGQTFHGSVRGKGTLQSVCGIPSVTFGTGSIQISLV